jgi:Glycosyl hydrolases family 16
MPPRPKDLQDDHRHENTPLTSNSAAHLSFSDNDQEPTTFVPRMNRWSHYLQFGLFAATMLFCGLYLRERNHTSSQLQNAGNNPPSKDDLMKNLGPYKLLQCQEGNEFFDYYDFYDGPDSEGSAGYNVYVSDKRAFQLGIANVTREMHYENTTGRREKVPFVYMSSAPTLLGPRESIRLEGRTFFNRGLFILDVHHMPAGCGIWPAWWLTNEDHWPDYGEVDILEGINNQTLAKTALHTSSMCNMYAHVPDWSRTGVWDRASKLFSWLPIVMSSLSVCFSVSRSVLVKITALNIFTAWRVLRFMMQLEYRILLQET